MSSTAVILLNDRRPQNIGEIVRAAAEALPDPAIFVLDQAEPEFRPARKDLMRRLLDIRRLHLVPT